MICKNCIHFKVCKHKSKSVYECEHFKELVMCKECIYATELDKHCEINRTAYKHCGIWRGDETKMVWHKYKKYYKDYSLVSADDFCSYGELKEGEKV